LPGEKLDFLPHLPVISADFGKESPCGSPTRPVQDCYIRKINKNITRDSEGPNI
jgi:hypothetical protein